MLFNHGDIVMRILSKRQLRALGLQPVQHFVLNPSHPVWAKLDPLGELPGPLQVRDVLWRVQNQLLQLTLRNDPHHDVSMIEEHRDALGLAKT